MTVLVRQLRKDGLYYKVVTAGIPKIDLVVDTWVFLGKEGPDYLFCNWWDYFRHDFETKHGRPSSNRPLRHRPDTDPVTGEPAFHEFCKRADLASWIEQVTERMDKEEKVEEPDDEARKRPKHKAR